MGGLDRWDGERRRKEVGGGREKGRREEGEG